jgi:hypothetical protein
MSALQERVARKIWECDPMRADSFEEENAGTRAMFMDMAEAALNESKTEDRGRMAPCPSASKALSPGTECGADLAQISDKNDKP